MPFKPGPGRAGLCTVFLAAVLWSGPAPIRASCGETTVDRIAALVAGEIVTLSEIEWLILFRGFTVPDHEDERRKFYGWILNRIVEQKLVAREAVRTPGIEIGRQDVEKRLQAFRSRFADEGGFQRWLSATGMEQPELRAIVRRQVSVQKFLELRFRPFIIVLPDEVESYYLERLAADLTERGQPVPDLRVVEESIRQILVQERTSEEMDRWLRQERLRSGVDIMLFREPSLAPNLPVHLLKDLRIGPVP